jgi:hypothetical protein
LTGSARRATILSADPHREYDRVIQEIIVKRFAVLYLCFLFLFQACTAQPVTEKDFAALWRDYLQREFEEGFDEEQSISQREALLRETAARHGVDYEALIRYMAVEQVEKHEKIFLRR